MSYISMRMMKKDSYTSITTSTKALFWKYGIRRVTIEEICKEAGVSRMTFYRYFDNKEAVARKVLEEVLQEGVSLYREIMRLDISFPEKIRKLILLKHASSNHISHEFLSDIYQHESDLKALIDQQRSIHYQEMFNDFQEAQKDGWIRKDVKMDFLFQVLDMLNEKMGDDAFLSMYSNSQEAIMELTNFFFYGILTPKAVDHV